jgi:hypothetical protein
MLATGVYEKGETTGTPAASIHVASMGANPTLGDRNVVDVRFNFPFSGREQF